LDEVVLHTLEKEPERRYQQASQVKTDVETIARTPVRCGGGHGFAPTQAAHRPAIVDGNRNAKEATIVFAGSFFFLFLLAVVLELSRASVVPFKGFLILVCILGLLICALSLAGLWPFPSPWFPEPNFSSRNLRRGKVDSETERQPHFSRTAIVGALWAPLFFIAAALFFTHSTVVAGELNSPPPVWQLLLGFTLLPLGLTAPFGTTILGGIAISQIRHSRGRLHGLGLAVFDVLLFPLLVLNALMLVACLMGLRLHTASRVASGSMAMPPMWVSYWWLGVAVAGIIVLVNWLIIRAVWRAANKPVAGDPASVPSTMASPPPPRSGGHMWKSATVILLILTIPVGPLLIVGLMKMQSRDRNIQAEVIAEVPIMPPRAVRFGPVQDVILNDLDDARGNEGLSFANSRLLSLPADFEERTAEAREAWLDSNRVDLLVEYVRGQWGILSRGVQFRDLPNEQWNNPDLELGGIWPDSEVLVKHETRDGTFHLLPTTAQPPLTFAFFTSRGEQGVLQVTGLFTNVPRGMKLRYKLAHLTVGRDESGPDFIATYRVERSQEALDAARDFVEEHQWKMQSESGNHERVVFKATDIAGRSITFENAVLGNGRAQFTISAEPGAELSAGRIGAAIWRRLGWAMPDEASAESPESGGPVTEAKPITQSISDENDVRLRSKALQTDPEVFGSVTERVLYSVGTQRPITGEDIDNNQT
jgi:hypothetical protein